MTQSPPTADQVRSELYEVMQQDHPFEEKANKALELGEAYLDVENGHLTQIDERIDFWEAIASTDPPDGDFPAGEVLDLQTTYCRRVIQKGSSIALSDAPNQGWAEDPAYQEHGLHCYHGTPLTIDGEVFGTICFVSEAPREDSFRESETLFAELIARMLENELRLTRQETELNLQRNLIGVLSRVLRHNLRNDLNVVRGQLSMIADRTEESLLQNSGAVEKIDRLVELANTARQIESIASSDLDRQPVELNALIENVIDSVQSDHPAASFAIEGADDVYLEAIPTLQTALKELIDNAAKHSGGTPEVTVSITESEDELSIEISDNGPGLPQQEREVIREGSESPLIHGSGLGLWLTYWIVSNHDGSMSIEVSDKGTNVTVTLPKTSGISEFAESETLLGQFHREQDKFKAVFDESFDAIYLFDDEGRFIDVNSAAAELFGLPAEELTGRQLREFVPEDYDFGAAWAEFMNAGRIRDRFTLVRADGTERIAEYAAVSDIVPGQHLAIVRDVTELVTKQEELRETSVQLQAIVTASPEALIALDTEGVIQLWNEAAEDLFGYPADEVIGEPIQSLDIHEEGQTEKFAERFKRAIEGERFRDLEVRRQTKSGDDVHLSISTAPLQDRQGEIDGLLAVARDIGNRVKLERRYEALREGFPDLCFIIDEDGVYQDVLKSSYSSEQLYVEPAEFLGSSLAEILPSDVADRFLTAIERTVETGGQQVLQYELEVPAGTRRFEARTSLLSDTLHSKRLVSVVVRDITERPDSEAVVEAA